MCSTPMKFNCCLTSRGTSARSFWLRLGRMNVLMPARCAASTFSRMPPTGRTRPRRVISPVMGTSRRAGRRVKPEIRAVAIVIPADGPSFGMPPAGT